MRPLDFEYTQEEAEQVLGEAEVTLTEEDIVERVKQLRNREYRVILKVDEFDHPDGGTVFRQHVNLEYGHDLDKVCLFLSCLISSVSKEFDVTPKVVRDRVVRYNIEYP